MLSWLLVLVYRGVLQIGNKIRIKKILHKQIYTIIPSFVRLAGNIWNYQLHTDWEASSTLDSVFDDCTPAIALHALCNIYERKWRHQNRRHYDSDVIYMNATTWLRVHTHIMTVLEEFCRIIVLQLSYLAGSWMRPIIVYNIYIWLRISISLNFM